MSVRWCCIRPAPAHGEKGHDLLLCVKFLHQASQGQAGEGSCDPANCTEDHAFVSTECIDADCRRMQHDAGE